MVLPAAGPSFQALAAGWLGVPWWQQSWALFIFLILAVGVVLLIRRYEITRMRMHNQMKISQMQTAQLRKLDILKSQFSANISHELRTPITLIRGPLIQLMEEHGDAPDRKILSVMLTNTNRLLQLIDQLLDLSKLDSGDYPLQVRKGPLPAFLKKIVMTFASLAEQEKITLTFADQLSEADPALAENCYFDPDVMEKIMNNILINAFKFTPEKGSITVSIRGASNDDPSEKEIEISIADSGIGIPHDKLPYIFDRFYQVDASSEKRHQGAGIGLAYVKELARVHHISVSATSQVNRGTQITLRLCAGQSRYADRQVAEVLPGQVALSEPLMVSYSERAGAPSAHPAGNHRGPMVLVVEDHQEVGQYIIDSLSSSYQVTLVSNAPEGIRLARTLIPELIISDIMMPGVTGIELCRQVKNDVRTSHIPVILLTARAGEQDRLLGLQTGTDDYLTKPFNPHELKARVENLIDNRRKMRERFSSNTIIRPAEISVTPHDQLFLENLMKIVENNLLNEQFSIDDLAREAHMSQSQLHRKLKAVVNQSAHHFVRSVRMQRAKELLHQDAGNIADVAYMVGYNDPGYFTRIFKSYFGMVPSQARNREG